MFYQCKIYCSYKKLFLATTFVDTRIFVLYIYLITIMCLTISRRSISTGSLSHTIIVIL